MSLCPVQHNDIEVSTAAPGCGQLVIHLNSVEVMDVTPRTLLNHAADFWNKRAYVTDTTAKRWRYNNTEEEVVL